MDYQPPFSLEAAIEALGRNCAFALVRAIFEKHGLSAGGGWKGLADKVNPSKNKKDWVKYADVLVNTYRDQILLGRRTFAVFDGQEGDSVNWKGLAAKAAALQPPTSPFSTKYPLPIQTTQLQALDTTPHLVEVRDLGSSDIALVFSSSRSIAERDTFERNDVSPEFREKFGDFNQLIVVKQSYYQAFDVLVIRGSLDRMELRLDTSESAPDLLEPMSLPVLALAESLVSGLSAVIIAGPRNIFPAIESMYRDQTEGHVASLSFQTITASIKRERMRRDGQNLRTETFHAAGVSAIGDNNIQPYQITVGWDKLDPSTPDHDVRLTLPGQLKALAAKGAELTWSIVENCVSDFEFRKIATKLLNHSQPNASPSQS